MKYEYVDKNWIPFCRYIEDHTSGSGMDYDYEWSIKGNVMRLKTHYHMMNDNGYYTGSTPVCIWFDMSGKEIDAKPLPQHNIFPDAVRVYSTSLGQHWMLGQYKVEVAGGYGKTGKALTSYATVIVFPWRLALIVILALIILGILIKTITRKTETKTSQLEKEIEAEKQEIEKLKKQLKGRPD